ncbi:LysR substrate-binding domain-containing protein [Pseudomonas vancouverensis]|uniref:LysR family transcriptional regulator n=1 Tax=Pseudomonas vancouverensis TaxID=95300 RepID=A0A1H2NAH3_PSEVA|nr:LysR substrate-binding domain-containing protein [Pseudomonas vancouverensis]KAB0494094.1 LysR family transcriptional regulator [Pseudomonas vancouverensis]TDB61531.1 LysR family transcriptional regulator [Pseudomonas vancouverensis]SDV02362.1 transcriptional regulator, LysR family [Pseudomonas vancouverensis]
MDKIRHVPSLQGLQALVEVAESGSFTQAALKLCLTQSAVSRQIQQLESHFGVALFVRSSRSIQLTPEGEQVLASARAILDQLRSLEDRLAPQQRPFRIRMHVSLAVRWLLPRLSEFYRHHPDVSLSIETVATEVVEPASDSDAYILYLPQPSAAPDCLTLFEEALVPVCAPGLGSAERPLASLDDLSGFALLHRSSDQNDWRHWLNAHGGKSLADYRHIPFNLDELALDAAARGLGVAMTDLTLAGESIERGVLVVPFGEPLKTRGIYSLCLQPSAAAHPACAAVMQWFTGQASH